ncbi:MAG: geranylgeranyl reductase [Frankiales bacterium]|nr:geranylgeranyl reductase [Frankiales bacterium]
MTGVWDLAVVGAGPAGAAAARAAAEAGARVLLLEKAEIPRYKRCGGGLIGPAQRALADSGVDVSGLARDLVGRFTFTHRGGRAFTREAVPFLPMVLRSELDATLVGLAREAGTELTTGVTVGAYAEQDGLVTLGTSGGPVLARAVVAADGSASRASAYVGVHCDLVDIGLEAELPRPPGSDWDGHVLLDWGPVPGSYGWVFPKGDVLTVGVIGSRDQGPAMRDYYRAFVASLGLDLGTAIHDGGHQTRVRTAGSPLRRGQVLVAGDAAGLLEPWTREGISFALRSGRLAGLAAVGELPSYEQAVESVLGAEVAAGRRALAVFTRRPGVVHRVMRTPPLWPLLQELVSGRTTMADQLERRRVRWLVSLVE